KETAVILPVLIGAHAWLFPHEPTTDDSRGGRKLDALRAALPYLALTAAYAVERSLILSTAESTFERVTTQQMVLTWPALILYYLRLLFFPNFVSPHYNLKVISQFGVVSVALPALALAAVVGLALALLRRAPTENRRLAAFSLIWILVPILP